MLSAAAVLLGCAWAQSPNTAAIEKQLIANERTINIVVMTRDIKTFKSLVAPDGMGIDVTGKGTWQGQTVPSPTYASTTWVKQRDGKWLAKFHQESIAMSPKPASTK